MSKTRPKPTTTGKPSGESESVPALAPPRLPYHPAIEKRFGVDRASWIALVNAIFPGAKSTDAVILALSYCRARRLDPFKRTVHIVPIWDSKLGREVESVWPGIGELRTTAFRTGAYAGREPTIFGDDLTVEFTYKPRQGKPESFEITFPEWAQVTVYRVVNSERVAFHGPRVYWLETYSRRGGQDCPNSMWARRSRGQLDKCAEAAALRAAFPEEIGDQMTDAEVGVLSAGPVVDPEPSGADRVNEKLRLASAGDGSGVAQDGPSRETADEPGNQTREPSEAGDGQQTEQATDAEGTQESPEAEGGVGRGADMPGPFDTVCERLANLGDCRVDEAARVLTSWCGNLGIDPKNMTEADIAKLDDMIGGGKITITKSKR